MTRIVSPSPQDLEVGTGDFLADPAKPGNNTAVSPKEAPLGRSNSAPAAMTPNLDSHRGRRLERAESAMREVAAILHHRISADWQYTQPEEFFARAHVMITRSIENQDFAGIRELESLPNEDLLELVLGTERATERLTKRAERALRAAALENPQKSSLEPVDTILAHPLEQMRSMVSTLRNPAYCDDFVFSRPKYRAELQFLVGKHKAELILKHVKMNYPKRFFRRWNDTPSLWDRIRILGDSDETRMYQILKANVLNFQNPFHILSYENLDRLTLVLGRERATELVAERGRFVLTNFLGISVSHQDDVIALCRDTVSGLRSGELSHRATTQPELFVWFLLGPNMGAYTAKHGSLWTL